MTKESMPVLNVRATSYERVMVAHGALGNKEQCFTFELVKSRLIIIKDEQRSLNSAVTSTDLHTPPAVLNVRRRLRQKGPSPSANHRCPIWYNLGHSKRYCRSDDIHGEHPQRPGSPAPKPNSDNALIGAHRDGGAHSVSESAFVCLLSKVKQCKIPAGSLCRISDSGCTARYDIRQVLVPHI